MISQLLSSGKIDSNREFPTPQQDWSCNFHVLEILIDKSAGSLDSLDHTTFFQTSSTSSLMLSIYFGLKVVHQLDLSKADRTEWILWWVQDGRSLVQLFSHLLQFLDDDSTVLWIRRYLLFNEREHFHHSKLFDQALFLLIFSSWAFDMVGETRLTALDHQTAQDCSDCLIKITSFMK